MELRKSMKLIYLIHVKFRDPGAYIEYVCQTHLTPTPMSYMWILGENRRFNVT